MIDFVSIGLLEYLDKYNPQKINVRQLLKNGLREGHFEVFWNLCNMLILDGIQNIMILTQPECFGYQPHEIFSMQSEKCKFSNPMKIKSVKIAKKWKNRHFGQHKVKKSTMMMKNSQLHNKFETNTHWYYLTVLWPSSIFIHKLRLKFVDKMAFQKAIFRSQYGSGI